MIKKKNLFQNLLCAFFILFPFIEIFRTFFGDSISVFGIAIEELFVILFAGILFIIATVFAFIGKKYKLLIGCAAYYLIFIIFAVLHGLNVLKFNTSVFPSAKPDFIIEAYYLIRMYALPFSVFFSALFLEIPKEKILFSAKIIAFTVSLTIIITDIFGISYVSYSDDMRIIEGSFFSWFSLPDNTDFAFYTAKGLFKSANAIGAMMFAVSPFVIYSAIEKKKISSYIASSFLALAMIMLGTKVAFIGFIISLCGVFAIYVLRAILRKEYKSLIPASVYFFATIILYLALLYCSPGLKMHQNNFIEKKTGHRETDTASVNDIVSKKDEKEKVWTEEEISAMEEYMENKHYYHYVNEWFLDIYPVRGDMDFWIDIATRDNSLNQSNRDFKIEIVKRIVERNANEKDKLFGIGHSSSVPYTERDYIYQKLIYGIIGVCLFILPFFGIMLCGAYIFFRDLFKKKDILPISASLISLAAYLFTAYFAGHVFDILMNMYFISIFAASVFLMKNDDPESKITENEISERENNEK